MTHVPRRPFVVSPWPWLGIGTFLALFFFYPFGRILHAGLFVSAGQGMEAESWQRVLAATGFTFYQAALSTGLTLLVGLPAAYLFARYRFWGKPLLRLLTAVPFMLPTVVVAAGFNAFLGPRGWLNLGLMRLLGLTSPPIPFLGTLGAILLAHVFYNTTIVIRLVGNALAHLDPRLEEAARSLGADATRVLRFVVFPLLRPPLLAATLLVFIFDFTSFGVVLLLGGTRFATLEVEIYLQTARFFNLPLAALLSLVQLMCTLVFALLYSRVVGRLTVASTPKPAALNLRRPTRWKEKLLVACIIAVVIALFVLPLLSLPLRSLTRLEADRGERGVVRYGLTLNYYRELFINRRGSLFYIPPVRAIGNSLGYATLTVLLSLALGLPVARALARPRALERWLDPLVMMPLGASAVTLGLGLILAYGRWLTSPLFVPLAHTLIAIPFVIRSLQPPLASIPQRLREAATILGASPRRVWFHVDWPIVRRALASAAVFAFTVSLGEFGATSLIARPTHPTLPLAIARFLSQPGGLNYGQAMAMATLLMLVCAVGILLLERLRLPGIGEF